MVRHLSHYHEWGVSDFAHPSDTNEEQPFRHLNGQIDWSGGLVRYTLAGVLYEVQLPPLTAYLDQNTENDPIATVYTQGGSTPLIMATLGKDGFAKVGMTKLFTKLLNNPWPGLPPRSCGDIRSRRKNTLIINYL